MLNIEFYPDAWDDYLNFTGDKKLFIKINTLIKDIVRGNETDGIGKPEALKGVLFIMIEKSHKKKINTIRNVYAIDYQTALFIGSRAIRCKFYKSERIIKKSKLPSSLYKR